MTTRRKHHGLPNYITGLGEGITNGKKSHEDDQYDISYLRARDRTFRRIVPPSQQDHNNHNNNVIPPSSVMNAGHQTPDDSKWGYYYSLNDPSTTSIGPWQIAAFALLGAVILLSALFLHILADGTTSSGDGSFHSMPHTSSSKHQQQHQQRRSSRRAIKKKKTDEWSDDASDVEAHLLSESVRGRGAYGRSDSFDYNDAAPYYEYAPKYPQQLSRHRKNSSSQHHHNHHANNNHHHNHHGQPSPAQPQVPGGQQRSVYQNAYRCPTPSVRLTAAGGTNNLAAFSPSIVHRTVSPALAGPTMPTRLAESSSAESGEGGVRIFSSASSMDSFSNHGDSLAGSQHVQQPLLQPRPGMRSSGGRKASPTVTIQGPIHEERTPDAPRDLLLPPQAMMEKTPRMRNSKIITGPDVSTPSPGRQESIAEIDSGTEDEIPIVMPFLPNLNPSLNNEPPAAVNMSDIHLYTMMESGNVDWRAPPSPGPSPRPSAASKCTSSSSSRQYRTLSPDRLAALQVPSTPTPPPDPPSYRGDASEHVLEMSESVDDCESLDSNDPRRNIQHKRPSLIISTDSAASLQGAVNFDELELKEVIGGGGFGQVWKAVWRGTPVAVKVLTGSAQAHHVPRAILEEFAAEINLLKGMRHPNICLYMGACLAPPNRAIITELAANGSLWDALRLPLTPPYAPADGVSRHAWPMCLYQPDPRHGVPPSMSMRTVPHVAPKGSWPWVLVKRVACGSARGMAYLHSGTPPVLHRDLKSANILLDESYVPKVCDFGLSRLKAQDRSMTGNCGTVQWMAPEVLANQSYNEKADIYSYGIILWELLTRQCPYEDMSAIQCALAVLNKNHRPEIPRWCPPALQVLIRSCLKKNPDERPSFTEILQALDDMP